MLAAIKLMWGCGAKDCAPRTSPQASVHIYQSRGEKKVGLTDLFWAKTPRLVWHSFVFAVIGASLGVALLGFL